MGKFMPIKESVFFFIISYNSVVKFDAPKSKIDILFVFIFTDSNVTHGI